MIDTIIAGGGPNKIDSALSGNPKPIFWRANGRNVGLGVDLVRTRNADDDGLGSWTDVSYPTDRDTTLVHTIQTDDATGGTLALFERASLGSFRYGLCWTHGNTLADTCSWPSISGSFDRFFALRKNSATNVPMYALGDSGDLAIRVSSNLQGTGTWSSTVIASTGDSFEDNSLEVLTGGGYGLMTVNLVSVGPGTEWRYRFYYTTSSSGTSGWSSGQTLWLGPSGHQEGLLGVDGLGFPFIVQRGDPMNIWRNTATDGSGTWSIVTTLDPPTGAEGRPDYNRAILLTNSKPGFVYYSDTDIFFAGSSTTSAAGTWSSTQVNSVASFSSSAETMSINLSGNGNPHIMYLSPSPSPGVATHWVQATGPDGF